MSKVGVEDCFTVMRFLQQAGNEGVSCDLEILKKKVLHFMAANRPKLLGSSKFHEFLRLEPDMARRLQFNSNV